MMIPKTNKLIQEHRLIVLSNIGYKVIMSLIKKNGGTYWREETEEEAIDGNRWSPVLFRATTILLPLTLEKDT